jgi:hypothetical protein
MCGAKGAKLVFAKVLFLSGGKILFNVFLHRPVYESGK